MYTRILGASLGLMLLISACNTNSSADTTKPEENRFTKVVLTTGMDEPMTMAFLPENRIIIVERKGGVKVFDETYGEMSLVTTLPVNTKYTNKEGRVREAEEGLMGVIADPDYQTNHWIYMYYADPDEPKHVLARWELQGDSLIDATKKIILEVPTQREECCHTGGGMVFDSAGNLYLTIGNNTVNPREGSSNLDERPGHENADDQRGPSNTNDLRGKIIRIHPEDDGTYTIPEGNLFPKERDKTRPEIYTMGHRNPWRVTLDSKTGYLYWGEVGPDANVDSIWGPRGYDEFNQAKGPGFHGWPYFVGNNLPYNEHDLTTETYGPPFDVNNPINNSVNNTGLRELPKPIPAFIWYPYGPSEEFPLLGSAGRSATGGPIFRKENFQTAPRPFPDYYEGKWLIIDFMRDWIMSVTMDNNGDYVSMERFLPNQNFSAAIDMDFGPSGDLYILEYGDAWFRKNSNSQLVKLEYNAGNRKPTVMATSNKLAGAVPFTAQFSSAGTTDYDQYDKDALAYDWKIVSENGFLKSLPESNPSLTFEEPGIYEVSLTVTDSKGENNSATFEIVAGNTHPEVVIDLKGANRTFYFGDPTIDYSISVNDQEDGTLTDGGILASETAITFDYVPAGFDPIDAASNQSGAELLAVDAIARNLIEGSDCKSCHQYDSKSIGPSYTEVAKKYRDSKENRALLTDRIINGSSGIWGEHAMAAHPDINEDHARRMVNYIMTINDQKPTIEKLMTSGSLKPVLPEGEDGSGVYLLRAAYKDKGAEGLKSLSGEAFAALRNPVFFPPFGDVSENTQYLTTPQTNYFALGSQSFLGYKEIDLSGIEKIEIFVSVPPRYEAHGGFIELHLDSPAGSLVSTSNIAIPKESPRGGWGPRPTNLTPEERKARRRRNKQVLSLPLSAVQGIHDLYFVFKNEKAGVGEVMVSISEIEFYPKAK